MDIHPALYDLYFRRGGVSYRCHMSSREKRQMIQDYENEQNILETLQTNNYKEIVFPSSDAGRKESQHFIDTLNIKF